MAVVAGDVYFSSSSILSTTSDRSHKSTSRNYSSAKPKQERQVLSRNQQLNGPSIVDSYLSSPPSTVHPPSLIITRQDIPKIVSTPKKRYVSSFKTLVNSTNDKHTQRLNYIRDSVMILKLSKEKQHIGNVNSDHQSGLTAAQFSSKQSIISMSTTTNHTSTSPKQAESSSTMSSVPTQLSPILKIEGQKRRTTAVHHDLPQTPSSHTDVSITTIPSLNIAMNPSSQPTSLTNYRNHLSSSNMNRQRTMVDASSNGLLFTTERIKSNISLTVRPTRPSLTTTSTSMSSAYYSSQQSQRQNINQAKSRLQQDRIATSRESYDYADPFTNCPQDLLNKLAQLTKLQLETIEWERKKRFTKKKPSTTNASSSIIQGKDSP